MALGKLFNLFALSSLAVLVCNLQASPVAALAHDGHHMAKVRRAHGHDAVLKRKRDSSKRCKPRPSSTPVETPAPSSSPEPTPSPEPTTSQAPDQSSSYDQSSSGDQSSSSSGGNSGSSGSNTPSTPISNGDRGKIMLAWPNGNEDSLRNFVTNNVQ